MTNLFNLKTLSILLLASSLIACDPDDNGDEGPDVITPPNTHQVTFNMEQVVNGVDLQMNTTNYPYTNGLNQTYKVTKLQYLISNVKFNKADGTSFTIDDYHYVDLNDTNTLTYTPSIKVPEGEYTSVEFTFGFDENDNISGAYADLNTVGWNWPNNPAMMFGDLGGGYHFLRLEGDFINRSDTAAFKSHMGTARDTTTNPFTYVDNHFQTQASAIALNVQSDFALDIVMNIEEWYINPITWDFTIWNAPIMPTYEAQRALNSNGKDVFVIQPA